MVERVRPVGGNVTDATIVEALGACAATYTAVQETAEAAKQARALHSAELKKWKGRGLRAVPLRRAVKERFEDPADVIADQHAYVRYRALQNMPTIQQDLMAMWAPIDLPVETQDAIHRQRWTDDGAFCARQGQLRDANPHTPGSEAWQAWDAGWLHDQDRIARAMGAGAPPIDRQGQGTMARPEVKSGRNRPVRKKAAAPTQVPGPRGRRRTEAAMH